MRCGYNNEVPNCFECKKRDYDNWAKCNGVESLATVYIVKHHDYCSSVIATDYDEVAGAAEQFIVDDDGNERELTEHEHIEIASVLAIAQPGGKYDIGEEITVECKRVQTNDT